MNYRNKIENYFVKEIKTDEKIVELALKFDEKLDRYICKKGHDIINHTASTRSNNWSIFRANRNRLLNNIWNATFDIKEELFSHKSLCFIMYVKMYSIKYNLSDLFKYPHMKKVENEEQIKMMDKLNRLDKKEFYELAKQASDIINSEDNWFFNEILGERVIFERLENWYDSDLCAS